jgi:nucleotide-binding universal stress UspA family protein
MASITKIGMGSSVRHIIDKTQEWEKKTAKKGLDQICDKYLKECPLYIKHIGTGDPARAILRFIEHEKVDMVAMATCGSKGHSPLGSVAEKVLKNSYVSVVTVPIRSEQ